MLTHTPELVVARTGELQVDTAREGVPVALPAAVRAISHLDLSSH
jgi:hypothetical protein